MSACNNIFGAEVAAAEKWRWELEIRHTGMNTVPVKTAQRRARLDERVYQYAARGWHVESRSDFQVTIAQGRDKLPTSVNLVLTLLTGGLWLIYWIFAEDKGRVLLTVSESGELKQQLISGKYELKDDRVPMKASFPRPSLTREHE